MLVVKYYRKLIDVQHLAGAKVFVALGTLGLHLQAKAMMVYYMHTVGKTPDRHSSNP
jgi:hypothetical protein